jgi:5'-3' exonuclease
MFVMEERKKFLIFDMSNILYKTFYVNRKEDPEYLIPLAFTTSFATIQKYYKIHKPDKIIMCFDSPNWRKDYTLSEACHSKKIYKGHRRQNMTPHEQDLYDKFKSFIDDFRKVIEDCTSFISMYADKLEVDDIVAGLGTIYGGQSNYSEYGHNYTGGKIENELVIISEDGDFIQLLQFPNVTVIKPSNGMQQTLEEYGTVDKFMFMKIMQGDAGDNVPRVKPRLQKKKILEAYDDPYKLTNILQESWTDIDDNEFSIQKLYNENKLLMDLTNQPSDIQEILWETIDRCMNHKKVYNHFKFIKFIGKYNLKMVEQYMNSYKPMMSL